MHYPQTFFLKLNFRVWLAFFVLITLITACDGKYKPIRFDKKGFANKSQPFAYELEFLGRDSFYFNAIAVDSNVIYRIKSLGGRHKYYDTIPYYIDSSADGGRTWSKREELFRDEAVISVTLWVGKGGSPKYVITSYNVYSSQNGGEYKKIDRQADNDSYIMTSDFKRDNNTLTLLTENYMIWKISPSGTNVKRANVAPSNNTEIAWYYEDSFFLYDLGDRIKKLDTNGTMADFVDLPDFTTTSNSLFIKKKNNYYFCSTDQYSVLHSKNYGTDWTIIDSSFRNASFHCFRDDSRILRFNAFLLSQIIEISNDYGRSWDYFSDTVFYPENFAPAGQFLTTSNQMVLVSAEKTHRKYYDLYRPHRKNIDAFASLESYSIAESPRKISIKVNVRKGSTHQMRPKFLLYGASSFNYEANVGLLSDNFEPTNNDATQWETSFNPDSIDIVPGKKYKLELYFADHTKENHYNFPELTFTPVSFFDRNKAVLIPVLIFVLIMIVLGLMYLFSPYSLYVLHSKMVFFRKLADFTGKFGIVFNVVDSLTIIPLIARQPNVLDAWVAKHKEKILAGFRQEPSYQSHLKYTEEEVLELGVENELNYIPLPLSFQTETGTAVEPDASLIGKYFRKERMCIEIVGMGGLGKTTLALKIGEWASDSGNIEQFQKHLWLPILIDEETSDLFKVVTRKVNSMTGTAIDTSFVESLLQKQRLLIIVDALSEKTAQTQQHIARLYDNTDANAVLLTTRQKINVEGVDETYFFPKAMDGTKVLDYIRSYFAGTPIEMFHSELNNSMLLTEILTRFQVGNRKIPIIPILINLILEKLKEFIKHNPSSTLQETFAQIPASVPDVFSDYLTRVNPKAGPNTIPDAEMLNYAEIIAETCIGKNFIPKKVRQATIEANLKQEGATDPAAIIKRLVNNGVLTSKREANDYFIGFAFDPIAEYLAAIRKAKQSGSEVEDWKELYESIGKQNANSFGTILETVHISCGYYYGWAKYGDVMKPES